MKLADFYSLAVSFLLNLNRPQKQKKNIYFFQHRVNNKEIPLEQRKLPLPQDHPLCFMDTYVEPLPYRHITAMLPLSTRRHNATHTSICTHILKHT